MNNMQIDNAKDLDDMMPIYNLIEYNDNYSKSLFIFCRDEPNNPITDSELFQFKGRITRITTVYGNRKDIETAVPVKCLIHFKRIN